MSTRVTIVQKDISISLISMHISHLSHTKQWRRVRIVASTLHIHRTISKHLYIWWGGKALWCATGVCFRPHSVCRLHCSSAWWHLSQTWGFFSHICGQHADLCALLTWGRECSSRTRTMSWELCLEDVRQWMATNWLQLSDSKTEFNIFGSKHNLSLLERTTLTIGQHLWKV